MTEGKAIAIPKTCVLCRWMKFDPGEPGYDDYDCLMPETDWSSYCGKKHWEMDGCDVTEGEYYRNLLKATTCDDFELSKMAREIAEEISND